MLKADFFAVVSILMTSVGVYAQEPSVLASDVEIRVAALTNDRPDDDGPARVSLVKLGPGAIGHLTPILLDAKRGWELRTAAAWVLGEIPSDKAIPGLEDAWALVEAPGPFRIQVAIALGSHGKSEPLRSFLTAGASDKVLVAKAAIAAANHKDVEALPLLKPLLGDPEIGSFVAIALGRLGDESAIPQVRPLLKDPVFRDHAAVAIAGCGDRTIVLPLRFALKNSDPFIRSEAAAGLGRFGDHESRQTLVDLSKDDPDPRVRKAAGRAVIRMGKRRIRR